MSQAPVSEPRATKSTTLGTGAAPPRPAPPPVPARPAAVVGTLGFAGDTGRTVGEPVAAPRGSAAGSASPAVSATDATMAASDSLGLDATISPGPGYEPPAGVRTSTVAPAGNPFRTTVLPRVEIVGDQPQVVVDGRARYETLRTLGAGGVGEVALAHDHDIDRPVAIKRLRPEQQGAAALIRFADEVRTVGKLEHPNIVPVHDVGLDERGHHFFVMKYVDGETLETVIEKLAAGDPAYRAKYTFAYRVKIFQGILHAIQYAHAQGVIHRDIKPANVMVGRYGEVMVMDWGLAKRIRGSGPVAGAPAGEAGDAEVDAGGTERERLFRTRHGALLGTPAYMSPEQARGRNDELDESSDVYSLGAVFHELLTGRHYLDDCKSVPEMLISVQERTYEHNEMMRDAMASGAPMELLHVVRRTLIKDPSKRTRSVNDLIAEIIAIDDGIVAIDCPVTLMKRSTTEVERLIDKYPHGMMFAASAAVLITLFEIGSLVFRLVH